MNDTISISSSSFSNNSSNNSKSNSLNRSELNGSQFVHGLNTTELVIDMNGSDVAQSDPNNNVLIRKKKVDASKKNFSPSSGVENHFLSPRKSSLPDGNRRRAKSQVLFNGDDLNTITEQNKLLIEDLYYLKKQLKSKDNTILDLNDIRDRLESEIHELSVSLFEQAYTMVNTAKAETAQAEKLLKEANGKIDVLQAEVTALKQVVITNTTPNNVNVPNKHLQSSTKSQAPKNNHIRQSSLNQQTLNQISKMNLTVPNLRSTESTQAMPSITCSNSSLNGSNSSIVLHVAQISDAKTLSTSRSDMNLQNQIKESHVKTHKRGLSHNDIQLQPQPKSFIDKLFNSSTSHKEQELQKKLLLDSLDARNQKSVSPSNQSLEYIESDSDYIAEFNELYFNEINDWRNSPDLLETSDFTKRIYREDIRPCLSFNDTCVSENLLNSIRSNCVCIEELNLTNMSPESLVKICGLSNIASICNYKIRLKENGTWIFISKHSRNRVISVCDFFTYLRYIKDGLVKCDINEIYWNIIDLRKKMCLSRLGL